MANILHISRTMDIGGAEKIVYQLATDLKAEFDNVHVASTGGLWEEELNKNGIKHHKILDVESKSPKTLATNFNTLRKIIKENKIDIIHTHHRMAAFYARLLMYIFPKVKHIYTAHNIFDNKIKMYKYSLKGAKVIAVGEGVSNHLKKDLSVDSSIIYNAIPENTNRTTVREIVDHTKIKIGFIGRLSEQKGLAYLIDAIKLIEKENIHLFIAGDGDLKERLLVQVRALGLDDKITFLGYREDTTAIINSCDFMVMPSLYEGLPLTLIEYFQNSKTVVGTTIPGIQEVVVHEVSGLLVKPGDALSLSKEIQRLSTDVDLRSKLEEQTHKIYGEKFSYNNFISKYLKTYLEK
ncbi:glycosyltransferase family 4 protein [Gemella sp. 20925_1_85]|uniref:glycosyltransferase family 4 protein n=1 Tax=Gemella sp. 20925_1_85 TaxID=3003690 RepID=UPI00352CEECC